jgi:maltooligosyltrehalose trehalohydrolase
MAQRCRHRMPFGAEIDAEGGTRFRLWAPAARAIELAIESQPERAPLPMSRRDGGWFERHEPGVGAGHRYRFVVDGGPRVPDPASRFQPDDVHGASEIVDPLAFAWPDEGWRGRPWEESVIYELHVGTFTREGNFAGVARRLDDLADLHVTAIELMPIADWPGRRNWGYDGCYPFAPDSAYGRPEALKTLIAAAHGRGIMVFLDVVYNHFGPEGNDLALYAPDFFTGRYATPWGKAIDFARGGRAVREFFIDNALYWIEEFCVDGLRLDAVHAIFDDSSPPILMELAERVHAQVGPFRHVHLMLENDNNEARYLERRPDGRPRWYVAQWNDDLHHACHVLATGEHGGYYADYAEEPMRCLGRAFTAGFAYQGERSPFRGGRPRGEPSAHLPPTAFVSFLQNHDQIGNRAFGERIGELASAEAVRALAAMVLLAPSPPLLFMGEEWDAPQPFPFFCDFAPDLADAVRQGRRREVARFPKFPDEAALRRIPDPAADATFESAVLDWVDRKEPRRGALRGYYRQLLATREREIIPRLKGIDGDAGGFRIYGARGLSAWWRLGDGARLALFANLGPEPLDDAPQTASGRLIFATHPPAADKSGRCEWPGWSVTWRIEEDADRKLPAERSSPEEASAPRSPGPAA